MKRFIGFYSLILLATAPALAQMPAPRNASPSASEILYSMGKESIALRAKLRAIAMGTDPSIPVSALYSGTFKVKVAKDTSSLLDRRVNLDILPASSTEGISLDPSRNWLAQVLIGAAPAYGFNDFVYPADPTTMTDWTVDTWRASEMVTRPKAAIHAVIDKCTTVMANKAKMFWFEVLPLHMHCRSISLPNLRNYEENFTLAFEAGTTAKVMKPVDYEETKSKFAVEVALGAALLEAQLYVEANSGSNPGLASDSPAFSTASTFIKNKARCFPVDGKPFVKTVLGSFVMPFNQTVATVGSTASTLIKVRAPLEMVHPEPSYAIGAYERYSVNDDTHNINMVANNFVGKDPTSAAAATSGASAADFYASYSTASAATVSTDALKRASIVIDNKTYDNFTFNGQGILHFKFNVRDVRGAASSPSCTDFCSNTVKPPAPFTPIGS